MPSKQQKNGGKPLNRKLGTDSASAISSPSVAAPQAEKFVPAVAAGSAIPAATQAPSPEPIPVVKVAPLEVIETAQVVEAVVEPVQEAAADTTVLENRKVQTMIEANTQKAQAFFADMNDRTKAAVEKSTKLVAEANDFAKGNLEAMVESGKITAKGLEILGQEAAEYSRKSFENATAAFKTFATVKSPTDLFKLQSDFFRTAFDSYVAEASKNTEAMLKLAGEAAQPLSGRVALAVEKAKVAA